VPDVAFIIDTPTQLAATDGPPRSRIQVAELGRYSDPRYGDFAITAAEVANWSKLLADYFQGRVPIDEDHATDKGGRSEAAAWITGLSRDGNAVFADVEWTPLGESAVRDKRYLYISPTFVSDFKDAQGKSRGPALLRAALTNNPFLRQMPAVSLSAGVQPAERIGDPPDSRPVMPDLLKTLAATLGLDEGADEATVLEAAKSVKAKADAKPPESTDTPKTLDALAKAEGKMVLDAAQVATLTENAAKGLDAAKRLDAMTFEAAWDKAFNRGALDAKPETKELHAGIYAADPERSLKLLAGLPGGVVNLTAHGEGGHEGEVPTTLDGHAVDPESAKLDQKVKKYMAEHPGTGYMLALNAIHDAEAMVL
jgi:phage I-like protein